MSRTVTCPKCGGLKPAMRGYCNQCATAISTAIRHRNKKPPGWHKQYLDTLDREGVKVEPWTLDPTIPTTGDAPQTRMTAMPRLLWSER